MAKKTLNITVPPELVKWLDAMVRKRVFATRSHAIEVMIIDGQKKYGH